MSAKVKQHIVDSYNATKHKGNVKGVGMAVVRSLAKDMNAHIDIISSLGKGSAISIYIPIKRLTQSSSTAVIESAQQEDECSSLTDKAVLIVENDEALLALLSTYLADRGMTVLTACDGHEAIDAENEYYGNIDFLISDIVLPRLSGLDVAKLFEAIRPSTKIFMMSGYPANAFPPHIEIPPGMSIITKPIDFEDLENEMVEALPKMVRTQASLSNMAGVI